MLDTNVVPSVRRANHVPGPPQGQWTYADYVALPDDGTRYEIIDGVLYQMTAAPIVPHQRTRRWFTYHLTNHVQIPGLGEVLDSPVDVELAPNVVVQPDVLVVLASRASIIRRTRVIGAPDLVIEVASPGTSTYDRREKLDAYAAAGVSEFWLADPATATIEVLWLENGRYRTIGVYQEDATLPSRVLPDFDVPVRAFFA